MSVERTEERTVSAVEETTECEGLCDENINKAESVDVVAGSISGRNQEGSVVVTGVYGGEPEIENWCTTCSDYHFGVKKSAYDRRVEQAKMYVTMDNILSFMAGVLLMLLVSSVMVV